MGLKNVQGWLLWNASPTLFSQKKFSFVKGKEMKKSLQVFYNKYLETNYIDHPKKELCYYLIGLKRGIRTSFSVFPKNLFLGGRYF